MFRASAAEVNLSPPVGGKMTGFIARLKPSAGIHDPIMARAVMLDDGETKAVVVSCDLVGLEMPDADEIRRRIAETCRINASNILLTCTHTHSGPATLSPSGPDAPWPEKPDKAWMSEAKEKIVEMVGSLPSVLEPACVCTGSATVGGIGYNRESEEHPLDESLGVIGIDSAAGQAIATIINYAAHAVVLGAKNLEYSADFPGAAVRHIARLRGGIGMYLQGACGDVDPAVYRDRGWGNGTFDDVDEIGLKLAEAAVAALVDAPASGEVKVRFATKVVDIPLDGPPTKEELDEIAADAAADAADADPVKHISGRAHLEWVARITQAIKAGAVPATFPVEISVLAINDLRLVGVPFEVFTDIGLGIKQGLKPLEAFFVGYANGFCGYYPTRWGKDLGGYGGKVSCRFGFGPLITAIGYSADELLIRESVALAANIGDDKIK